MQKLLKPDEAADVLAISPRTLWSMTQAGDVPSIRIGRSVRYDLADLQAFAESKKVRCPAEGMIG